MTLKKNHWRSELEKLIVITLSPPRFDERGNGGPGRSGDSSESQQLRAEASGELEGGGGEGDRLWKEQVVGTNETPQGQRFSSHRVAQVAWGDSQGRAVGEGPTALCWATTSAVDRS